MYINFGKYLVDFLRFEKVNIQFINKNIKIFGQDNLDEALKHGKGVIMLSCHIGNWELAGGMVGILGYPLNAIALSHKDNKVNNFFINQRKMLKMHTISIGISLKKCFRVLKENQLLAILADRDFSENGKEVMFFGRKALLPKGPAVFSLRTKAAIVPCFMIREPNNKFAFYMEKPIYPVSTNNPENDIGTLMNTYLKLIENYVRAYPDQWCVFRKIWN